MIYWRTPEAWAGVDDPVSDLLLSHPLFHQRLLRPEQLHRQLVVRRSEDVLQLVSHPIWLRFTWDRVPRQDWSDSGACLAVACFSFLFFFTIVLLFFLTAFITWMYLSGLVLPLVFRRGRRHPSPLKNGPGEVKNWKCAQNVATRALRGLCCLGFLHRISSAALLAPGVAATSERESCYWQLSIISFGNQFLLTPHIPAFVSVRNDFVSPVSPVRAWSHSRVGGASPCSAGCLHSHSCPVSHVCDAFH